MNKCAYDGYQKADAELNQVYQQLLPKVDPARLEKFKAAQRAWVALRDADCDYEASEAEGGTMEPLLRYSCFETATKARTTRLRAMLKELTSR